VGFIEVLFDFLSPTDTSSKPISVSPVKDGMVRVAASKDCVKPTCKHWSMRLTALALAVTWWRNLLAIVSGSSPVESSPDALHVRKVGAAATEP
jgi:hypothetical protein